MKTISALLLFSLVLPAIVFAQESSSPSRVDAACGPSEVQFDASAAAGQPPSQPEAGKALVYVIEDFRRAPAELANPTIRVGVDGQWMGAVRGDTYIVLSLDPGEHHLCTRWQSSFKRLSSLVSFHHLDAEVGKTYYYRARITYSLYGNGTANMNLDLDPVDSDEGRYLVVSSQMSDSHPHK
jgi:hypothetical protein